MFKMKVVYIFRPTTEPGSTMLAPPFFILLSWNIPRHIVWKQAAYRIEMGFFGKKVVVS